jgi:acetyl-CoA acetyltransferase
VSRRALRFEGVAVAGIGMVPFGMLRDQPILHLARDAGLRALHDADMTLADVDEAFVGYIQLSNMLAVKGMKELGLTGLPVTHIENASATGLVAFREAAWAVSSGRAHVALALGFDKFTDLPSRTGGGGASRGGGRDQIDAPILPTSYFALWAQRRMYDRGTKPEHFATIAAKNWNYGAACPFAHRRPDHVVTADEVLASRMIAEPLTSMMCCPADDGAACVILAREDLVRELQPARRLVRPLASALQSETYARGHTFVGPVVGPSTMTRDTANECYEAAGIGPDDVSVAYCHDAFVNEELEYYELLGFCEPGGAERLVEDGETGPGGRIPFNTDGGLIARGHPGGPTGLAQVHEAVLQLRGEATGRQVDGARVALAHLVGGGSVCTVNLLEAVG